jgi:excisionase family DNA binding protein
VSVIKLNNLERRYSELNIRYSMLHASIQNIASNSYYYQQQSATKEAKEVMSPSELAKYMNIEMDVVYDMANADSTMPYVEVNGEYRFNKAAIEKWMETRNIIKTK